MIIEKYCYMFSVSFYVSSKHKRIDFIYFWKARINILPMMVSHSIQITTMRSKLKSFADVWRALLECKYVITLSYRVTAWITLHVKKNSFKTI